MNEANNRHKRNQPKRMTMILNATDRRGNMNPISIDLTSLLNSVVIDTVCSEGDDIQVRCMMILRDFP